MNPNEFHPTSKSVLTYDTKKNRSASQGWGLNPSDYENEKQMDCIHNLQDNYIKLENEYMCNLMQQQIQKKIQGYRTQDIQKRLYDQGKFVCFTDVLKLMIDSQNVCYYCKNDVYVLYEIVREPKQWTLERLDNNLGHNTDNVVIACLSCNLSRKTMYHERFAFTKQLNIVKKD